MVGTNELLSASSAAPLVPLAFARGNADPYLEDATRSAIAPEVGRGIKEHTKRRGVGDRERHVYTHTHRERERERERAQARGREGERERGRATTTATLIQ